MFQRIILILAPLTFNWNAGKLANNIETRFQNFYASFFAIFSRQQREQRIYETQKYVFPFPPHFISLQRITSKKKGRRV